MNFCRNNGQNNGIPASPNPAKLPQPLNFSLFIAFLLTNFLAPNIFSEEKSKILSNVTTEILANFRTVL